MCLFGLCMRKFSSFRDPTACKLRALVVFAHCHATNLPVVLLLLLLPAFHQQVAAFVLILTPVRRYVRQTENFKYWILNHLDLDNIPLLIYYKARMRQQRAEKQTVFPL